MKEQIMQLQVIKEQLMQLQEEIMTLQEQVDQVQPQSRTSLEVNMRQMIMHNNQTFNHIKFELHQIHDQIMHTQNVMQPLTQLLPQSQLQPLPHSQIDKIQKLQDMINQLQYELFDSQLILEQLQLQPLQQSHSLTEVMQQIAEVHFQQMEEQMELIKVNSHQYLQQLQEQMKKTQMELQQTEKQLQRQMFLTKYIMHKKQLPLHMIHIFHNLLQPIAQSEDQKQLAKEIQQIYGQIFLTHYIHSQIYFQLVSPLLMENMHVHLSDMQRMIFNLQNHYDRLLRQMMQMQTELQQIQTQLV